MSGGGNTPEPGGMVRSVLPATGESLELERERCYFGGRKAAGCVLGNPLPGRRCFLVGDAVAELGGQYR